MATSSSTNPSTAIVVTRLDPSTNEESLKNFFSFCGKITSVEKQEKSATIVFENISATKTSVMLDGGTLDGSAIQVRAVHDEFNTIHSNPETEKTATSTASIAPAFQPPQASPSQSNQNSNSSPNQPLSPQSPHLEDISQEDKPRSAIAAEYLAHGYLIGDKAISKAIAIDKKHGISNKFKNYFQKIQEKANKQSSGSGKESGTDDQSSSKLSNLKNTSYLHYERAMKSPCGTKVQKFYTDTSKTIFDVHNEAKRIAETKLGRQIFSPTLDKSFEKGDGQAAAKP
ncbi:hypothetical protein BY996DRAFT_6413108 [Phakopsora pachyrhizi]|uniref:RRM domain-containing protein n=1 Tax=Phakopsora pachyrhizi TaxID=170000 RepID=A0AAV0BLU0_PHAPC|nr:hypothetical protein BY996DRAFT_6413108 [Phakopsora pachyrhizi]CAH7687439.1 hypothetical protein PPACK8108_LOCUS22217 [Phakopsora pachyrhizi]